MLANLMPSIQLKALNELINRPALTVTDTMNYWMNHCLNDLHLVVSKTDVLIINDEEALQLAKADDIMSASKIILEMGPRFLIIKKGTEGALLFGKDKVFDCGAFPVQRCKDPTGAGDTFAGAFIGYLNHSDNIGFDNMKIAVIKACAMASFCVEDFGVNSIINRSIREIEERVLFLKNKTSL